jgi:hypothetical protein
MPNIVASRCTVFGPAEAVARFRADCIRQQTLDAPAPSLDFEAVLPSPEILRGVRNSSAVSDGLAVLGVALPGGNPFEAETVEGMLGYPWVRQAGITTTEALKAALLARDPGCVAAAEAAINRVRETGYRDLGAWRRANWGVEDNASGYEEAAEIPFCFRFDTPWSFPVPVFQALAARYPALAFDCVCIDGGWNFGGEGAFNPRDGQPPFRLVEADARLYVQVHGVPPECA